MLRCYRARWPPASNSWMARRPARVLVVETAEMEREPGEVRFVDDRLIRADTEASPPAARTHLLGSSEASAPEDQPARRSPVARCHRLVPGSASHCSRTG